MSDLYSGYRTSNGLKVNDTGSPLEGAKAPPAPPGTTEEETSHGKDGGAGRLQNKNTEADLCLGAAAVIS